MGKAVAPARSPRVLVKIDEIRRNPNDASTAIIVKMKLSHSEFLGLTPVDPDDPIFEGTFADNGSNTNRNRKYRRRLGGFREASYTLVAKSGFNLKEKIPNADGGFTDRNTTFKTISIGFPKGHSVTEVIDWLSLRPAAVIDQIEGLRTPAGQYWPL